MEFDFVAPLGNFEFKKLPFALALVPTHFQKLINKIFKGIPLSFGYFDNILVFSEKK